MLSESSTPVGRFAGKVMAVTGASSGIGKATALTLAEGGAAIVAISRNAERLEAAVAELAARGARAIGLTSDVGEPAEIQAAIEAGAAHFGRIDGVVANAGFNGLWAPLEELDPEAWNTTLRGNLTGTFLTVKYALPYLKREGGAVVVVSSVNGTRNFSLTGATAYSAAKAGQVAFAKMIALELAPQKIRVNVVCPGAVLTNIGENTIARNLDRVKIPVEFPRGWMPLRNDRADPAQVARVIAFLLSDDASHVTGTEMWIDGGESLLIG